jgi:hypothetical protein
VRRPQIQTVQQGFTREGPELPRPAPLKASVPTPDLFQVSSSEEGCSIARAHFALWANEGARWARLERETLFAGEQEQQRGEFLYNM